MLSCLRSVLFSANENVSNEQFDEWEELPGAPEQRIKPLNFLSVFQQANTGVGED